MISLDLSSNSSLTYMSKLKEEEFMEARFDNERQLRRGLDATEGQTEAATKIVDLVGTYNALELHNCELVNCCCENMSVFIEVDCPVNTSRQAVKWCIKVYLGQEIWLHVWSKVGWRI